MTKINKKYNFSNIVKKAWDIKKVAGCSLSTAMKQAWAIAKGAECDLDVALMYLRGSVKGTKKEAVSVESELTSVSETAKETLDKMVKNVDTETVGSYAGIDNSGGGESPEVCIRVTAPNFISVTSYERKSLYRYVSKDYPVPQAVFWCRNGEYYPVYVWNERIGINLRVMYFDTEGNLNSANTEVQKKVSDFIDTWMGNVRHQQF